MTAGRTGSPDATISAHPQGLAGRRHELALLRQAVEALGEGSPPVIQIAGEPGIGKTRLLVELGTLAGAAGQTVLWGRAAEFERQVPFGIFTNALEDHLTTIDPDRLARLGDDRLGLLGRVFPALPSVGADAQAAPLMDVERYRLHRAMRVLLEVMAASEPIVLVLDDVHWADDGSVELLDHLLRHPPRARLLLALAYRPRQLPVRLGEALTRAVAQGLAEPVEVGPLGPADADDLFPTSISSASRRALYRASGGNPFYLDALVRGGGAQQAGGAAVASGLEPEGDVPAQVRAALSAELAALTSDQSVVAQAAAVAGEVFEADLVALIAGRERDEVLGMLDQLAGRDLVRPADSSGRFRYRHPLVRSVAYQSAPTGWRLSAHGRAAAALRARGAGFVEQALHVERSAQPGDQQAVDVLVEAAVATLHTTPSTAAHWLGAALRLVPDEEAHAGTRLRLLGMRAKALGVTGRLQESRDTLREVLRLLPRHPAEQRAQTAGFCAMIERLLGRHAEARALLVAELAGLEDLDGPAAAILKIELASGALMVGDFLSSGDWAQDALATARRNPDRALLAAALGMCAMVSYSAGTLDERTLDWLDEGAALVDALPDGDLARHIDALTWLGMGEVVLERLDDATRHLERGLQLIRATGQNHMATYLLMVRGTAYGLHGRLQDAANCYDDALESALLTGSETLRCMALSHRCWISTWMGDLPEALRMGEEAVTFTASEQDLFFRIGQAMLAQARLYAGDPAGCVELLLTAGGGGELVMLDRVSRPTWFQILAAAEAAQGHLEEAADWAERAQLSAAELGLSLRTGFAQLAHVHALLPEDPAKAVVWAQAAVESFTRSRDRVDAGRAHHLAGVGFATLGDTDRAREHFALARALFDECGARLFRDQTTREERRMNARMPRRSRGSVPADGASTGGIAERYGLTRRELEVAELVARGMTNREIADKLYLSPKTVEVHLSRVFAKLGVSSRAAVAGLCAPATAPESS